LHIPDGFLDTKTIIATSTLSAVGVTVALHHFKAQDQPSKIPLLGLAGAFVFAAQMLNFPVAGGTSGHLIGAVLTAILLGPSAAVIVITSVLFVQCFLFADGGVLALGANIFNMAIVASLCGYAIYSVIHKIIPGMRGMIIAAAFASWCSAVIASICCTGELALSGIVPWATAFLAMTSVHAIIGVGEGLITALVLAAVNATRPELLQNESRSVNAGAYTARTNAVISPSPAPMIAWTLVIAKNAVAHGTMPLSASSPVQHIDAITAEHHDANAAAMIVPRMPGMILWMTT
jgi:cobalt/nickel transport system permease protein